MARGKNSPALFEVIRNAQQKQKEQLERQRHQQLIAEAHAVSPAAALLRSPLYWFKGKQAHDAAIADDGPVMREVPAMPATMPDAPPHASLRAKLKTKTEPTNETNTPAVPSTVWPAADSFPAQAPLFAPVPISAADADGPQAMVVPALPAAAKPLFAPESPAAEAARRVREDNAARADADADAIARADAFTDADADALTDPDALAGVYAAQEAPAAEPMFASAYADDADDDAVEPRTPSFAAMPIGGAAALSDAGAVSPLLSFNYTTAIIGTFAVIVAGVSLYVITTAGRGAAFVKADPPAAHTDGGSSARPDPRPDVLDVRTTAADTDTPAADDDSRANVSSAGETMTLETIGRPIAVPTNVKRIVGHQYLVLLSFPADDDAKEFVKFLAQNGVPATAEKALPDYAKSWTSVVSARGFDHTKKNPAYDAYVATLEDLLQKYAGDSKFRKTFKIDKYTWRTAR